MLAGLLKSDMAINVSIKIVNTFVEMSKLQQEENIKQRVFFEGQIYTMLIV